MADGGGVAHGENIEGIEDSLARFAHDLVLRDVPPAEAAAAIGLIEDVAACMLAGVAHPECRRVAAEWSRSNGVAEASVTGQSRLQGWQDACFVNAVLAHWCEWDDSYDDGAIHACAVIFPVLLAAAERERAQGRPIDGREFMAAFVAALEIAARIGAALAPYSRSGWMPTGFAAPVGASAGAARLLGLTQQGIRSAMGLAAAGVALSRQPILDGVDGKNVLCALAASRAAEAARLAACGIQGAPGFLTGRFGIASLIAEGRAPLEPVTARLGEKFHIARIGVKPYPCCRSTHPAIDAVFDLCGEHDISAGSVARVEVEAPQPMADLCGAPFSPGDNPRVAAQFSIAYTVAAALVHRELSLDTFAQHQVLADARVLDLAGRVQTRARPVAAGCRAFGQPVEVTLVLKSGAVLKKTALHPKGSPERPMSPAERELKFDSATASVLSREEARRLRADVADIVAQGPWPVAGGLRMARTPHERTDT
jgi:2-methylcitrate dehydratase PrpD